MYLLLRERAEVFRADPAVQEALRAARVYELAQPTPAEGESLGDLLGDTLAYEEFDAGAHLNGKGCGFVRSSLSRSLRGGDVLVRGHPLPRSRRDSANLGREPLAPLDYQAWRLFA